jgi:hypothetical protein
MVIPPYRFTSRHCWTKPKLVIAFEQSVQHRRQARFDRASWLSFQVTGSFAHFALSFSHPTIVRNPRECYEPAMPNSARVAVAIVFIAIMALIVRPFVHFVVDLGFIPWLLMMGGIFWIGVKIENRDRAIDGSPPYSAYEAGQEVREYLHTSTPYILLGLLAFAFLVSRLT